MGCLSTDLSLTLGEYPAIPGVRIAFFANENLQDRDWTQLNALSMMAPEKKSM